MVHRDFKPANALLGADDRVRVVDFGLARATGGAEPTASAPGLDVEVTNTGELIGTPAYMSPEQAGGMVIDARSDTYSLGAIMYELFCGQPMFRGRSFGEYVRKHLTEMPVPPRATPGGAQLGPRLEQLIMK